MCAMVPRLQTYVSFVFSPAFENEAKGRETHLVEEEKTTSLVPGTLARVKERYKEVAKTSRELSSLRVPKGTLYFWFYDRLTITVRYKSMPIILRSDKHLNQTGRFYLDNEGDFFHRSGLESGADKRLPPAFQKPLLALMDQHNSNRIIQVVISGGKDCEENFVLSTVDTLISPNQVQMVDTGIPWCRP